MTRKLLCAALLAAMLLLTGCAPGTSFITTPITETTSVPHVSTVLPSAEDDGSLVFNGTATLYFRYLDEPYLAPETRVIHQLPSQTYEQALLSELIAGPGTASVDLSGLFPEKVNVLSTSRQGRTLFVTLSAEIMDAYPDEPVDWQESNEWLREVPLRRRLCTQSIVATVTENCNVDQVQILVQSGSLSGSLRLKQNYFMDSSEDSVLVGPMSRDDSLLLTAANTASVIMSCWQTQDWQRLYLYVAARDKQTGVARPVYRDFLTRMESLPRLVAIDGLAVSITPDGSRATITVNAQVLRQGSSVALPGRIMHFTRENGMWKVSLGQLISWLEDAL